MKTRVLTLFLYPAFVISISAQSDPHGVVVTPGIVHPETVAPGRVTEGTVTEGTVTSGTITGGAAVDERATEVVDPAAEVEGMKGVSAFLKPLTGGSAAGTIHFSRDEKGKGLRITLRMQGLEPGARLALSLHDPAGSTPSVDRPVTDAFNSRKLMADDRGEIVVANVAAGLVKPEALYGKGIAVHAAVSMAPGDISTTEPVAVGVLSR